MPSCRVLDHGRAPASSGAPLEMGRWSDVAEQGQFLLEMEFLSQYTHPEPREKVKPTVVAETACVYTTSPPYLTEISRQFPWVHFYAFHHKPLTPEDEEEYDPERPQALTCTAAPSYQTELNRTVSSNGIDWASIQTLSRVKEDSPERRQLVLICHGESVTRQLMLHATLRADYAMLDINGPIPHTYAAGVLMLPIQLASTRAFACLVVDRTYADTSYDSEAYMRELCEFLPFS